MGALCELRALSGPRPKRPDSTWCTRPQLVARAAALHRAECAADAGRRLLAPPARCSGSWFFEPTDRYNTGRDTGRRESGKIPVDRELGTWGESRNSVLELRTPTHFAACGRGHPRVRTHTGDRGGRKWIGSVAGAKTKGGGSYCGQVRSSAWTRFHPLLLNRRRAPGGHEREMVLADVLL